MPTVVGIRFKKAGKIYYFDPALSSVAQGDHAIVETARGVEYGEVVVGPREVSRLTCPKTSFSFKAVPGIGSIMQDLRVEMHNAGRVSETDLHPLFHGSLDMSVDNGAYEEATVYLMKNTNNIRVVLQQMNGGEVDDKNFTFRITDDNTLFAPDNSLISNGGQVYAPWTQGQRTVGVTEEGDETVTVAYAEFSTSRLVAGNHTRLTITRNSDNAQVLNIPLNEYLLLLKSDHFDKMGDQEFLDRENNWSLIFFLDNNHNWIRTHIVVNDWIVRINDAEL